MRTYYGKLSKLPKSGSGAGGSKLTERELWIKHTFGFLSGHIIRIKGRQCVTVSYLFLWDVMLIFMCLLCNVSDDFKTIIYGCQNSAH